MVAYRREIDGLRAVAVVPVILFHAGFPAFSGGFVGVDIFFVISGYLITSLLIEDIEQGRFSILRFYERRARRILPALFFVLVCCLPFAWMWLLPRQLQDFSQSVAAVTLFASNILFWMESGYFDLASELKPLLHTWSLAIEEQYYAAFPLLLFALWRFGQRRVLLSLGLLAALSLGLCEWLWRHAPEANFYLAPSRIWELLSGSISAFFLRGQAGWRSDILAAAGLAMILFAIFAFDERLPFPSLYALLPVGGTVLIILCATGDSRTGRLLAMPPLVGIGLVSYSAYLWHQPLFAFARIRHITTPPSWLLVLLVLAAFGLAALTWRYVEQPFRGKVPALLPRRRQAFTAAGLGGAVLLVLGVTGQLMQGFPQRLDAAGQNYARIERARNPYQGACMFRNDRPIQDHPIAGCTDFLTGDGGIDVGFIGDSHMNAFSHIAQQQLKAAGLSSYAVSYAGCIGLAGFDLIDPEARNPDCDRYARTTVDFLLGRDVGVLVLAARFPLYLKGARFDNGEGGVEYGPNRAIDLIGAPPANEADRQARVLEAYRQRILDLAARAPVILVYPVPETGWNVPQTMMLQARLHPGSPDLGLSTENQAFETRNREIIAAFDSLDHPNLFRVRPDAIFCNTLIPGRCANAYRGELFYKDDDHLSEAGAGMLVAAIMAEIEVVRARSAPRNP